MYKKLSVTIDKGIYKKALIASNKKRERLEDVVKTFIIQYGSEIKESCRRLNENN